MTGKTLTARALSRRRMLCITAASCGLPVLAGAGLAARDGRAAAFRWSGAALGTRGRIVLVHPDEGRARHILGRCIGELRRLERVFSLYEADSELVRLNRTGILRRASLDLRAVIEEAQRIGALTAGSFDVTVQPLWRLFAEHFRTVPDGAAGPPQAAIDAARRRVDIARLDVSGGTVGFLMSGMAATLNGIAQGYINDRIADLLRNEGFDRVLVALGEIGTLGAPDGGPGWTVGIEDPSRPGEPVTRVVLADRAIATSSRFGTTFDAGGRHHHLFDPASGRSASLCRSVSVIATRAVLSDALSTALAVLPEARIEAILRAAGAERAFIVRNDGSAAWYSGADEA